MTTVKRKRTLEQFKKDTVGDETVLLNSVKAHVLQRLEEQVDEDRRSDVMHPSEMAKADWCPRHDYYRISGLPREPGVGHSFYMETIFEEGHEIHRKWQRWLHQMDWLWGVFECRQCETRWFDRSPRSCRLCGYAKRWPRYREVPLAHRKIPVAGHSDGGIMKLDDTLRLLEVKSVSLGTLRFEAPSLHDQYVDGVAIDKIWWQVQRPFPTHLRQGLIYLWLAAQVLPDPPNEMVFIYEWKPTQGAKEFVVARNDRLIQRIINSAEGVAVALETKKPPLRPTWADEDSKTCMGCPYYKTCYHLPDSYDTATQDQALPVQRAKSSVRRRLVARPT